jgi:hypothetical protein
MPAGFIWSSWIKLEASTCLLVLIVITLPVVGVIVRRTASITIELVRMGLTFSLLLGHFRLMVLLVLHFVFRTLVTHIVASSFIEGIGWTRGILTDF